MVAVAGNSGHVPGNIPRKNRQGPEFLGNDEVADYVQVSTENSQ